MKEIDTINRDDSHPNTISSLKNDLRNIGITNSMILLVHSSLSSIGWVCGGPVAVIYALEEAIGNAFEAQGKCKIGKIGAARSVLFRQRDLVDFASEWMKQNR